MPRDSKTKRSTPLKTKGQTAKMQKEVSRLAKQDAFLRIESSPGQNAPDAGGKPVSPARHKCKSDKRLVSHSPSDVAGRLGARYRGAALGLGCSGGAFARETFRLSRKKACAKAREWFNRYPKDAYMTEIEFWRVCDDFEIELTMRRLSRPD